MSLSLWAPPLPVLPWSLVATVSVTAEVALAAVVKVTFEAATKALRLVALPVRTRVPVPDPTTVTPPPAVAASAPLPTDRVTCRFAEPASTSATEMPVSAVATSSVTAIEAGTVLTGASLIAVTLSVTLSVSVRVPPLPVLPWSLVLTVSVTAPSALAAVVKLTPDAAMNALRFAALPVSVSVPDPEPPTVTPLPLVAASEPLPTDSVICRLAEPASTSATEMPVSAVATSSDTVIEAGTVCTGASLTGLTVIVTVAVLELLVPSLAR